MDLSPLISPGGIIEVRRRGYSPDRAQWLAIDLGASFQPYIYVFNRPLAYVDPSGRAPKGGGGDTFIPFDPPQSTGPACERYEKERRQLMDKFADSSKCTDFTCSPPDDGVPDNTPPKPDCVKLSLYIDLGDPCDVTSGHTGVSVFGQYWDWGPDIPFPRRNKPGVFFTPCPGAPYWKQKRPFAPVTKADIDHYLTVSNRDDDYSDVIVIDTCITVSMATTIQDWWIAIYKTAPTWSLAGPRQCTSMAATSIAIAYHSKCEALKSGFTGLPPQKLYSFYGDKFKHVCGPAKGESAKICALHKIDWAERRKKGDRP